MPMHPIDRLWFDTHHGRKYRLRWQTQAELLKWPVPPRDGFTGWCVIREADGAVELLAFAEGDTQCDCNGCLEELFAFLRQDAA